MKHKTDKFSLATQLHSLALQQVDAALDYATNSTSEPNLAVHETRRCLKRLRALLRLVKEAVGDTIYDRDRRYLRQLGQRLAGLRDAAATAQTLASLQTQAAETLPRKTWQIIRKEVRGRQPRAEKTLAAVAAKLKVARSRIAHWPLESVDDALLRSALRKSYRRGRRAMKVALAQPQAEHLHEWRKQVNQLRHQWRILQTLNLVAGKERLQVSRALAQALGSYNDLVVLAERLPQLNFAGRETERHTLRQLIQTAQAENETTAGQLGQQLYQVSPKAFLKSLAP